MDRDRELAGQVDALLGRHGHTGENTDDRNVPLLTELVQAPDWIPAPPPINIISRFVSFMKNSP